MLYILWGLLNIGLFFFFIITCSRAIKLLKDKFGWLSAIIFSIGILAFVFTNSISYKNSKPDSSQSRTWNFASVESIDRSSIQNIDIELGKKLLSNYELGVRYGKDKTNGENIPNSASAWTKGFFAGTKWIPASITVTRSVDHSKFVYHVSAVEEWKLLGLVLYAHSKEYDGIALIE